MEPINWEEPKPTSGRHNRVFLFVDELKRNPMRWAVWHEGAAGCRATFFRNNYGWKGIEVLTERSGSTAKNQALYKIFLRYNPEKDTTINKENQ